MSIPGPKTFTVSLRLKIFLTFLLLTFITVALVAILVNQRFTEEMRANLANSLQNAAEVYQTYTDIDIDRLIDQASNLSVDARLRASLSTMDSSTVAQTVEELNQTQLATLLAVLDPDERFLAGHGIPTGYELDLTTEPVVIDAMSGFESGDIWALTDTLMKVAAIPIRTGSKRQGILLLGYHMDQAFLGRLRQMTNCHLTFLVNGQVPYSTYYMGEVRQTAEIFSRMTAYEGTWDFTAAGSRFLGIVVQIANAHQEVLGFLFIYKSLDEALASLGPLRWSIFFIALGSLALLLLFSYLLARGVTRPVEDLTLAIRKFGDGHYDFPVQVTSNDEVGTLAIAFEEMRQSLQKAQAELLDSERLSTVGSMANGIIHDFKQPITIIQGFTELLQLPGTNAGKRQEYGEQILSTLHQMLGMVNDLLDYARGETSLHLAPASLNQVINHAVNRFRNLDSDESLELTFQPGEIEDVVFDHHRILRVVENLLGNARDAINGPGKISVATGASNGGVVMTITDTGGGIPAKIQDTLFEPFITLGKPSGTGLGLAITKSVIEEHGGKISFTTRENVGTTFRIWLPNR